MQHREADPAVEDRREKAAPAGPRLLDSLTIDLTANRELWEVVTLALMVPPLLGWSGY